MNFRFWILILKRMHKFCDKQWDQREGKAGQGGSTTGNILID